jgi:3'-phosphoadenosine 5'-phosphosulfate sulfotransferase (PAPS reductase)/FAD synthetase
VRGEAELPLVGGKVGPSAGKHPGLETAIERSDAFLQGVIREYQPTHIVEMVSGGRDSAAASALSRELRLPTSLILHGKTGTGIQETTEHVVDHYGNAGPDFAIADAGNAYERYVMRKGFFGKGRAAHNYSYRILKADPFRAAISRLIRKRQPGVRVMLINGARKSESHNRRMNLQPTRLDKNNLWVNACHDWTDGIRDAFLVSREVPINPVAVQLCRSGECMCGTMQTRAERAEASVIYPRWGRWIDGLEAAAIAKHGFGWNDTGPAYRDPDQQDLFQPMCVGCARDAI